MTAVLEHKDNANGATLYMALELSDKKWKLGWGSPQLFVSLSAGKSWGEPQPTAMKAETRKPPEGGFWRIPAR